jgi:hypothetical protein
MGVAALPLLLGTKRSLFSVHPFYQFPDPIKPSLIRDPGRQALIMLDHAVEFDALLTHLLTSPLIRRKQPGYLY